MINMSFRRAVAQVVLTATAIVPSSVLGASLRYRDNSTTSAVNTTTCNSKTYLYDELAGYGFVPGDARDKFGDTLGGLGSAIALDQMSWKKSAGGSYEGTLWALPDRGCQETGNYTMAAMNTEGTLNFNPRVHKFTITFTPQPNATVANPASPNLLLEYQDTIRLKGPDGTPTTGLDADGSGGLSYAGFPLLPAATYTGDGFGGTGCANVTSKRISIDSEGLVINSDGSFWVSDEYGPYVYLFDESGKMTTAIRPPEAVIPKRNGSDSFSADSPPRYEDQDEDDVFPAENPTGRNNNHGFEGLSASADGKTLWVLLQAATNQEGGLASQTERITRFLKYDVSDRLAPRYVAEYVVPLPLYTDPTAKASKNPKVAAQSEVHALPNGQFFVLVRDSDFGHGQDVSLSVYRHIDVFDISAATDISGGAYDCETCVVANETTGVLLDANIVPATLCPFLDFNVNSQLNRFGVHNGGDQDAGLLNEKWESIGIVPVEPENPGPEYFVFSLSDNDFITQNGYLKYGQFQYADSSGFNLDNQALVFKVTLPS